ncbi:hypothetical protein QJQ45_010735 [Haematococcus lacustris]|nr:hypothetical protein QJQ45_010735 [Haematococcus lacustris]
MNLTAANAADRLLSDCPAELQLPAPLLLLNSSTDPAASPAFGVTCRQGQQVVAANLGSTLLQVDTRQRRMTLDLRMMSQSCPEGLLPGRLLTPSGRGATFRVAPDSLLVVEGPRASAMQQQQQQQQQQDQTEQPPGPTTLPTLPPSHPGPCLLGALQLWGATLVPRGWSGLVNTHLCAQDPVSQQPLCCDTPDCFVLPGSSMLQLYNFTDDPFPKWNLYVLSLDGTCATAHLCGPNCNMSFARILGPCRLPPPSQGVYDFSACLPPAWTAGSTRVVLTYSLPPSPSPPPIPPMPLPTSPPALPNLDAPGFPRGSLFPVPPDKAEVPLPVVVGGVVGGFGGMMLVVGVGLLAAFKLRASGAVDKAKERARAKAEQKAVQRVILTVFLPIIMWTIVMLVWGMRASWLAARGRIVCWADLRAYLAKRVIISILATVLMLYPRVYRV